MAPVKLETKAIQTLAAELQPPEMVVIYLMGLGKEIPDDIEQSNLVSIVSVLCRKFISKSKLIKIISHLFKELKWVEEDATDKIKTRSKELEMKEHEEPLHESTTVECFKKGIADWNSHDRNDEATGQVFGEDKEKDTEQESKDAQKNESEKSKNPFYDPTEENIKQDESSNENVVSIESGSKQLKKDDGFELETEENIRQQATDQNTSSEDIVSSPISKSQEEKAFKSPLDGDKFLVYLSDEPTSDIEAEDQTDKETVSRRLDDPETLFGPQHSESKGGIISARGESNSRVDNLFEIVGFDDKDCPTLSKSFFCSYCGWKFKRRQDRDRHENGIHLGKKPFGCSVCAKMFSRAYDLKIHKERTHNGIKPYKCSYCDYRCTRSGNLKKHEIINHTGEKPFSCSLCGKRFIHKINMERHERLHTGEKPYCCSICTKTFPTSDALKGHERTHCGKAFSCAYCHKSFSKASYLKKHELLHKEDRK